MRNSSNRKTWEISLRGVRAAGAQLRRGQASYAVLIDEAGKLASTGLVNTREHLESLFVAKETGVSSIQQFLGQVGPRRASSGE